MVEKWSSTKIENMMYRDGMGRYATKEIIKAIKNSAKKGCLLWLNRRIRTTDESNLDLS